MLKTSGADATATAEEAGRSSTIGAHSSISHLPAIAWPRCNFFFFHDVSPLWWLSIALKATTDCLGNNDPVRACDASSMESSTSN